MLPRELHLKSDLNTRDTSSPRSECRTDQPLDFSLRSSIMLLNCQQRSPCGQINVICPRDVHWDTHRWSVGDIGMVEPPSLHNERGANGLLPAKILKNPCLDSLLDLRAKELEHGQIHPCIH